MPEYSEVRLNGEYITQINRNRQIVEIQTLPTNKLGGIEEIDVIGKTLRASSRGKELRLHFGSQSLVLILGMSGGFKNFHQPLDNTNIHWKHSHLRFRMSDGDWFNWVDVRRFGKSVGTDWSQHRGPDIFDEKEGFIQNILTNLHHSDFSKPIYETLMNQRWFNGIGNYLRAEILGKWNQNPFQPANQIITFGFLQHLISVVQQSYIIGRDGLDWGDWMEYYGKGENLIDKGKRRFWFHPKWHTSQGD